MVAALVDWWIANRSEIVVNVVASIPFLLFDLVIIALVLPIAIEKWRDWRTRKLRGAAALHLMTIIDEAMSILIGGVQIHLLNRKLDSDHLPYYDVSPVDRLLLTSNCLNARRMIAESIPVSMSVLDYSSKMTSFQISAGFDELCRAIVNRNMNDREVESDLEISALGDRIVFYIGELENECQRLSSILVSDQMRFDFRAKLRLEYLYLSMFETRRVSARFASVKSDGYVEESGGIMSYWLGRLLKLFS